MRQFTTRELLDWLPHRNPFVLLDRVEDVEPGQSGTGIKHVSISDPIFAGHFPGRPIYPGVMVIEAAAQTAGVVATAGEEQSEARGLGIGYLASVKRFAFQALVLPGCELRIHVASSVSVSQLIEFRCQAEVDARVVAKGTLALAITHPGE